ncbi:MAG: hypothetical protein QM504_06925 [Pseudomonadota bacterium]
MNGVQKIGSVDTRSILTQNHTIDYKIVSGQVAIFNITPNDAIQNARDRLEKAGMYSIKKNKQGVWVNKGKITTIETELAAVNGQSNNLKKAAWLMGSHLEFEFSKLQPVKEFVLFHNPSVGSKGDSWESIKNKFGLHLKLQESFHLYYKKHRKKKQQ